MVLEDVTEFDYSGNNTQLKKILLNGNNICMVCPPDMITIPAGADERKTTVDPRRRRARRSGWFAMMTIKHTNHNRGDRTRLFKKRRARIVEP